MLECFTVSIQEDLIIDDFKLMEATKHSFQDGTFTLPKNVSLCHHVVRSSNIKCYNFSIELDSLSYLQLVFFPLISLRKNLVPLVVKLCLHIDIELLKELMILSQLQLCFVELLSLSLKLVCHGFDVLIEHILDGFNTYSPCVDDVSHAGNRIDHDVVWQLNIKIKLKLVYPNRFNLRYEPVSGPSRRRAGPLGHYITLLEMFCI